MTSDCSEQPPSALLRRALDRAAHEAISQRLPPELPGLLVDEGIWSPAEALAAIDLDRPYSLAALAPRLPLELALGALDRAASDLARASFRGSFHRVAGVVALLERLLDLGATRQALDALARLPAEARGLALVRVAGRLPADLRDEATVLADLPHSDDRDAAVAYLMFAGLSPGHRDALIARALFALGDWSVEPLHLQWMARVGAVERAVELARAEQRDLDRASALAAVLPWCRGARRADAWATWRELATQRLTAGRSIPLPLPASPEELPELAALARGQNSAHRRAVALAHLCVHHREYLDEALAAARPLDDLDRALALCSLLPALADDPRRHGVAHEAWTTLTGLDVDRSSLHERLAAWPGPGDEPPLETDPVTPDLAGLRARVALHLAPVDRRAAALALLAAARRLDDGHYRAAALAALASHLPDPDARARALGRAESLALASARPSIALGYMLAYVDPDARPQLARRALDLLPDELDGELFADLAPLLAALPPADAGALLARAIQGSWSVVNDLWANVAAAVQAGAIRPLAELFLGDAGRRNAEHVLPQLLRHADAELHPRIAAVLLRDFEHPHLHDFPDILAAAPWLSPAEQLWLVDRIPKKPMGGKFGNRREPVIVALARPLAEQGALDRLRPLLRGVGRPHRLAALAHALPFLEQVERERVTSQIFGELRRGNYVGWRCVPALVAAGLADSLVDVLSPLDFQFARIAPHVSPGARPRLLDRLARAIHDNPTASISSDGLRLLGPLLRDLPRDVLAHLCERALADAGRSGRHTLLRALVAEEPDDGDYQVVEPGLTRALAELAGPSGLPACIDLLDDPDHGPS